MTVFDSHVSGIPCRIEVTHHLEVKPWKGSVHSCPSDVDYHGYTEVEFEVQDRRGRAAPWLAKKLTERDRARIEGEARARIAEAAYAY